MKMLKQCSNYKDDERWWKMMESLPSFHSWALYDDFSSRSLGDPAPFALLRRRGPEPWDELARHLSCGGASHVGQSFPKQMMVWYSLLMFVLIGPGGCINAYWGLTGMVVFFVNPYWGLGCFFDFFCGFRHWVYHMFRAKCGWICSVNMITHVPNCRVDKSSPHFGI